MKRFFFIVLIYSPIIFGQNFYLSILGNNKTDSLFIENIFIEKKHKNVASVLDSKARFENLLSQKGYIDFKLLLNQKINDSTFIFKYTIGNPIEKNILKFSNLSDIEKNLLNINGDSLVIVWNETEPFLKQKIELLEKNGFALASIKLDHIKRRKNYLESDLILNLNSKRTFNEIVFEGYSGFPNGIKKAFNKKIQKLNLNKENIKSINNELSNLRFVNSIKYPEILFTKDSTKLYVFLEKNKPNKFDGFIGFTNDDNSKLRFNGYLDLQLLNILNSGEKFNIYWKNDGNQQSTFSIGTDIPYIFKSSFGIQASLRIFKQDSTFQNTTSDLNFGYHLNYNTKILIGYQKNNSVDIQNIDSSGLNDFTNIFYTTSFDYVNYNNNDDIIFPEKSKICFKSGIGNRNIKSENSKQLFAQLQMSHHFYLNNKNSILLKNESYYLQSDAYIINELHRFGGINSIRGFSENSLQANLYSSILTEYRYKLSPSLFVYTILDYGYFQDKTSNLNNQLVGLGLGLGILTKNGLFNLIYANGSSTNQVIKLSNSIVHLSFKSNF